MATRATSAARRPARRMAFIRLLLLLGWDASGVEPVLEEGFDVGRLDRRREIEVEDAVHGNGIAVTFGLDDNESVTGRVDREEVGAVARPTHPGQAERGRRDIRDGDRVDL